MPFRQPPVSVAGCGGPQESHVVHRLSVLSPEQIVRVRKCLGLPQEQLAAVSGFGIASICRWETGVAVQNASSVTSSSAGQRGL
jgi:DNA-binding transcriptional regulator YiaG